MNLVTDDEDLILMLNGFHDVIINSSYGTLHVKPYGNNVVRGNKKDVITYKYNLK